MFRSLRTFLILLLSLSGVYASATSLGVVDVINTTTNADLPELRIAALDNVLGVKARAEREARNAALRVVRAQIEKRYGPEAVALIPEDASVEALQAAARGNADQLLIAAGSKGRELVLERSERTGTVTVPVGAVGGVLGTKKQFNTARRELKTLTVKGRAPATGYDRSEFGDEWSDAAGGFAWTRNGCDTRNDVLARDLGAVRRAEGCKVLSGTLAYERYTGATNVKFVAGGEYRNNLDVEHIVSLKDAWVKGAQGWSQAQRAALANDPTNLFAADPSANRSKSDSDAASWLPPNKAYRCAFVSHQIRVKAKYGLWVTAAERDALARVLGDCPK